MNFKAFLVGISLLFSNFVFAQHDLPDRQNPCKTLDGISGGWVVSDREFPGCSTSTSDTRPPFSAKQLELRVATETLSELRRLIQEVEGLRSEMRAYNASLVQARAGFEAATNATIKNQEAWRKSALEQTLSDVQRIPARLSLDDDLRNALAVKLRDELPRDPAFVEAVRAMIQP